MNLLHRQSILYDIPFAYEIVVPVKPSVAYTKSVPLLHRGSLWHFGNLLFLFLRLYYFGADLPLLCIWPIRFEFSLISKILSTDLLVTFFGCR